MLNFYSCVTALVAVFLIDCTTKPEAMKYTVKHFNTSPLIDAEWNKTAWNSIQPLTMANHMGEKPEHFPFTQAKVAYDDEAIYVIFKVEDQYVKAVYRNNQDPVYKDSCVEFFFSPEATVQNGYFNLEMNCGGTMLFYHQQSRKEGRDPISDALIDQIAVAHTLPKIVDPELEEETTWAVEYRIPFSVLKGYHHFDNPVSGAVWRANFYKCADDTSHPHWLTWSPVGHPTPQFHLPEFFGKLVFE